MMLKDSAPEKWEYRKHTKVKHILLEKYLSAPNEELYAIFIAQGATFLRDIYE